MGAYWIIPIALIAAAVAPSAAATDPFNEPVCPPDVRCVGAGACFGPACAPRGCQPIVHCRGAVEPDPRESDACAVNSTIDGRTCAVYVGARFDHPSGTGAGIAAHSSNGSVRASNLHNTWSSPGAEADASVIGEDLGRGFVYLYRSDILTEGQRRGAYGLLMPADNHTWTEIGVVAGHHGGPAFDREVVVAVKLLDLMPEGCYVRSPTDTVPDTSCPRPPVSVLP